MTHSSNVPSSSIMVTVIEDGVIVSGLVTDAETRKVSSSSSSVSPSIVSGRHIELSTAVVGGMLIDWLTNGWKSAESEANRKSNQDPNNPLMNVQKTIAKLDSCTAIQAM